MNFIFVDNSVFNLVVFYFYKFVFYNYKIWKNEMIVKFFFSILNIWYVEYIVDFYSDISLFFKYIFLIWLF